MEGERILPTLTGAINAEHGIGDLRLAIGSSPGRAGENAVAQQTQVRLDPWQADGGRVTPRLTTIARHGDGRSLLTSMLAPAVEQDEVVTFQFKEGKIDDFI